VVFEAVVTSCKIAVMANYEIRHAVADDLDMVKHSDWLDCDKLAVKIQSREVIVCSDNGQITGILRWGWFWDHLPFINFIWVEEGFRREGRARRMVAKLQAGTEGKNYGMILASTQSDELDGQKFFRGIGFVDAGGFTIRSQALEVVLVKNLIESR
jgi:ribosomal protein S18 acetylase RimI-like enzyme